MAREVPKEPTADQCNRRERVEDVEGYPAYACWYPQMGGYVGRCVVVIPPDESGHDDDDRCFDVFIWHDGEFPFSDDDDGRSPARLHHCMPSQFIRFGEFVLGLQRGEGDA